MKLFRICLVALGAIFLIGVFSACEFNDQSERIAFVYGISIYISTEPEGSRPNLQYCDDDADEMAKLLEASGYTVYRRITGNTASTFASGKLPSRQQIKADIASVPASVDRVVFYYSGHGLRTEGEAGAEVDYIVPYGAIDSSGAVLMPNLVSSLEFHSWIDTCAATQTICILDSCHSGGFVQVEGDVDFAAPMYGPQDPYGPLPSLELGDPRLLSPIMLRFMVSPAKPSQALVLSAAGAQDFSYESGGHGIFTKALLESVLPPENSLSSRSRADLDGDGYITVIEAFSHAALYVENEWNSGSGARLYEAGMYADFFPHLSSGSLDSILFSY